MVPELLPRREFHHPEVFRPFVPVAAVGVAKVEPVFSVKRDGTELFHEGSDTGLTALPDDVVSQVQIKGTYSAAALPADDHPIDAIQRQRHGRPQRFDGQPTAFLPSLAGAGRLVQSCSRR